MRQEIEQEEVRPTDSDRGDIAERLYFEVLVVDDSVVDHHDQQHAREALRKLRRHDDPFIYEPVWCGDRIVGHITSGAYGHHLGASVGLAYVDNLDSGNIGSDQYEIEIAGIRYPATASLEPLFDPGNKHIRR